MLAVAGEPTGSQCLLFVGEEELGWKGTEVQLPAKGSLKTSVKYRRETNNPFHLTSFSHLAHILSLLSFLSICPLPPLFTYFTHSFFLLLCGKFNGFLGWEWDILSLWTIITRLRATSCNSLTPTPRGYNPVFCVRVHVYVCRTWTVHKMLKPGTRLVKPSAWKAHLYHQSLLIQYLQSNSGRWELKHSHTSATKWKKTHRSVAWIYVFFCSGKNKKWKFMK